MRILHLSKYDRKGGAAIAALNAVRAQRALGIDATLHVGMKLGEESFVHISGGRARTLANFAIERLPFRLSGVPRSDVRSMGWAGRSIRHILGHHRPDVVVLHNVDGVLPIDELAKIDCPVVWRMHDMWPICSVEHYASDFEVRYAEGRATPPGRLAAWVWRRKQRAYRGIPSLTLCPPSRWLGDCARRSTLLNARNVRVIPNGIATDRFAPVPKELARRQLGVGVDSPVLLFGAVGGGADPRKGFDLLVDALRLSADRLAAMGAELLVFGGGDVELAIPGVSIRNLGRINSQDRLPAIYSAADVVAVPSRMENLSLTVIEALACGTPVIAFEVGGMPDLIRPGETGWLSEPFATDRFAADLIGALSSARSDPGFARRCRTSAEERFDSRVEAKAMFGLFEGLAR